MPDGTLRLHVMRKRRKKSGRGKYCEEGFPRIPQRPIPGTVRERTQKEREALLSQRMTQLTTLADRAAARWARYLNSSTYRLFSVRKIVTENKLAAK